MELVWETDHANVLLDIPALTVTNAIPIILAIQIAHVCALGMILALLSYYHVCSLRCLLHLQWPWILLHH